MKRIAIVSVKELEIPEGIFLVRTNQNGMLGTMASNDPLLKEGQVWSVTEEKDLAHGNGNKIPAFLAIAGCAYDAEKNQDFNQEMERVGFAFRRFQKEYRNGKKLKDTFTYTSQWDIPFLGEKYTTIEIKFTCAHYLMKFTVKDKHREIEYVLNHKQTKEFIRQFL